ncbi:hypothetical protein N802_01235 [Knoellia sinensis KCTC 19936]|uniref:DUF4233 domain-containing protein n=1 Tax=Knoellia sinensis KCTC 19936 TaxID=1385520 RepID=A0A0A0JF86_9MICO|nr:DUF4233 domain-containing protein [Knoellia sinensis]KGN34727.1 hypothetical protein N802_01235 [Knoellia sinensis KCTC 19936]
MSPSRLPVTGRLGKFTWRMLAVVLGGQALVIFFGALVARATALADGADNAQTLLWLGSGLAVLAVIAAGLLRGPLGLPLGWLVQVLTFASAVIVPAMFAVGLIFTGLWVLFLVKGQQVDAMMAARESDADTAR